MKESNFNKGFNFGSIEDREDFINNNSHNFCYFKLNSGYASVFGARIDNKVFYAISMCSPLDNFSKRKGRELAYNSFVEADSSKRGVMIIDNSEASIGEILKLSLETHLKKMRRRPNWVKNPIVSFRTKR